MPLQRRKTYSSRVWREVPESDARSVVRGLAAAAGGVHSFMDPHT